MKKTPTLFIRDEVKRNLVTSEPNPECQWVFRGEGVALQKIDGTCCMITEDGAFLKRREVKKGKPDPEGFMLVSEDSTTGKRIGWLKVEEGKPDDRWHLEAFHADLLPGTYELIGPKIQGNPERADCHRLVRHVDIAAHLEAPREYEALRAYLAALDIEGLVWHHPDGRMAKIKKKDFGFSREP